MPGYFNDGASACFKCKEGCSCTDSGPGVCDSCLEGYKQAGLSNGEPVCEKITGCAEGCASCHAANNGAMCVTCTKGYSQRTILEGYYACDKKPLSAGAIAGIVIGVLAVLGIAGGLAAYFICRGKKARTDNITEEPQGVAFKPATV